MGGAGQLQLRAKRTSSLRLLLRLLSAAGCAATAVYAAVCLRCFNIQLIASALRGHTLPLFCFSALGYCEDLALTCVVQALALCCVNMRVVTPPLNGAPARVSTRSLIVVGTGITHGELHPVKGRLILFDVAKQVPSSYLFLLLLLVADC